MNKNLYFGMDLQGKLGEVNALIRRLEKIQKTVELVNCGEYSECRGYYKILIETKWTLAEAEAWANKASIVYGTFELSNLDIKTYFEGDENG